MSGGLIGTILGHSRVRDRYSYENGYYLGSVYTCPIHGEIPTWEVARVCELHDSCDPARIKPKSRRRAWSPVEMHGRSRRMQS